MATRNASAKWQGNLTEGDGSMALGSGAWEGPFTFKSRFEEGQGTNPEELIGAALAGCFTMQVSHMLSEAGNVPDSVETQAKVQIRNVDGNPTISQIDLVRAPACRASTTPPSRRPRSRPRTAASSRARSRAWATSRSTRRSRADQPQHQTDREEPAGVGEDDRVLEQLLDDQRRAAQRPEDREARPGPEVLVVDRRARAARARRRARPRTRTATAAPWCRPASRGRRSPRARQRARR